MPTLVDPAGGSRRRLHWFLFACTLVALVLRLPLLGRSVWFDEVCMSSQRIGTWEQLLATLYVDIHPPLFVSFMHVWGRLFGDGELALRLPALLAGLLSVPLTYWAGHRLVGATAAAWATVFMALSPVHIWYSAEARLYSPMLLSALLAIGTFDRVLDDGRPQRWLWPLHFANVAVMLTLHYYLAVYVVALACLAPICRRGSQRSARRILIGHGIGVLLLGGFIVAKRALGEFETSQDYLRGMDFDALWRFLVDWCWTGHTLSPGNTPVGNATAWVHQALGGLLLLLGCVHVARTRGALPRGALALFGLLLLPGFLIACKLCGYDRTYMERSAIAALPFVFLVAGAGLASSRGRLQVVLGAVVLVCNVAALVGLFLFQGTQWTVYKPNSDWRAAAAFLGREIDGDGAGRAVFTSTPNPRPLSYYDVRIQDEKNLALPADPQQLGAAVQKRLGAWFGDLAESTFRTFAAHNAALLAGARLRSYPSSRDPELLNIKARSVDDVCYLVRDHWHPHVSVDGSIEALLEHPRVQVLESKHFQGISVHKVRILP